MACFLVPAGEAIVTTIISKSMETKTKEAGVQRIAVNKGECEAVKIPFCRKLKWLSNFLWGGSALLAFEHVWHGEVIPWFPFLSAASNSEDAVVMLQEMSTAGVSMAVLVTVMWLGIVVVTGKMEKRASKAEKTVDVV